WQLRASRGVSSTTLLWKEARRFPRRIRRRRPTTSAHLAEVDGEAAHVAPLGVGDDQRRLAARVEVTDRKTVDAVRDVAAVFLALGRTLVLHECRLDLPVADDQAGRVTAREALALAVELGQQHEPVAIFLEQLVGLGRLQRLAAVGRVAGGDDEPVKGRQHADRVAAVALHLPLGVEGLVADALLADANRLAAAVLV